MKIFITGMTGTLGTALAKYFHKQGDQVFGCARDEYRAQAWLQKWGHLGTLFVGDCLRLAQDRTDIGRLLPLINRVYHCAAMKHVDLCEANPQEAYNQNVVTTGVLSAVCQQGPDFIFVSSDKACLPQSVYGATKFLGESITLHHGGAVVRLGNLIGSSGSVFETWFKALEQGKRIELRHPGATRFFIPVDEAAKFLAEQYVDGRVVIPWPMRAVKLKDVALALAGGEHEIGLVGLQEGEVQGQWLTAPGDKTQEFRDCLVLGQGSATDGIHSGVSHNLNWDVPELIAIAREELGYASRPCLS